MHWVLLLLIFMIEDLPQTFSPISVENILPFVFFLVVIAFALYRLLKRLGEIISTPKSRKFKKKDTALILVLISICLAGILAILSGFGFSTPNAIIGFFHNVHQSPIIYWLIPYSENTLAKYGFILLAWFVYMVFITYIATFCEIRNSEMGYQNDLIQKYVQLHIYSSTVPKNLQFNEKFECKSILTSSLKIRIRKFKLDTNKLKLDNFGDTSFPLSLSAHDEFTECRDKTIWTYESWKTQQKLSKVELNRPVFKKKKTLSSVQRCERQ